MTATVLMWIMKEDDLLVVDHLNLLIVLYIAVPDVVVAAVTELVMGRMEKNQH
jgi:hypothetical protein